MKSWFSVVFGYAFLFAACAPLPPPPATTDQRPAAGILGGQEVSAKSPLATRVVGVIGSNGENEFLCTGVLIGSNSVLTAGHCGAELQTGEIVFSTDLSTAHPKERRKINSVVIQPKFNQTIERLQESRTAQHPRAGKNWGDLAILYFTGTAPTRYQPVPFSNGDELENGTSLTLAGYGMSDGRDAESGKTLSFVEVQVKNVKYSKTEFSIDQRNGQGACHGDSGGPAFMGQGEHLVLVGITSRGSAKSCQRTSIYTRVSPFADWIDQQTNNPSVY